MLLAPHVFAVRGDPTFNINYEVAEVVWTRLAPLANGERHDTETKPMAGKPTIFNGYRLGRGHFVWGLTYRMLKSFFSVGSIATTSRLAAKLHHFPTIFGTRRGRVMCS